MTELRPLPTAPLPEDSQGDAPHVRVAVIGAGFAGLGMAIRLKQQGIEDFVVLERAGEVGGTWRDNTYPGSSCDVPSALYSFSFAPNPGWSSSFSPQPEIQRYLRACTRRFGLRRHLRCHHEVLDARWDGDTMRWVIETTQRQLTATVLVSGTGQLSEPAVPELPGLDRFEGAAFHSARWEHSRDLAGARVAVVGTGASAVQFVPEIAEQAAALHVFARSAPWVLPRSNRTRSAAERNAYRAIPGLQRALRAAVYWGRECAMIGFASPRVMRMAGLAARLHLRRQVPEPGLRAALTPDYTMGCKRVLRSSDFYPALRRPNVDLVSGPIREVRPRSVIGVDGAEREVDTIIFGTGFAVTDPPVARRLHGRDGRLLADRWSPRAQAYLGTTVAGFPNLFLLLGPNSALGHNSVVLAIESQVEYVLDALRTMDARGIRSVEVRPGAQSAFVAEVAARTRHTVWATGGCASWYLDEAGHNTTLWPGFTSHFRRLTRRFDPDSYLLRAPADAELVGAGS
ncbi:MAG: SidA/IucD/PvdA family monooxygenase [Pseudonocardiaceae bacterium]|nr:SidA/IucD/PvdA family monooxygenase [Pseudonocardiaceae bacterium]